MANSIHTPAKPADFGTDIVLGTADDTRAVETVLARARPYAAKVTDGGYFWVDFRTDGTPLYCEDSVNWPGSETAPAKNLGVMIDHESRSLGIDPTTGNFIPADQADKLGLARDRVARNRAHFVADWAQHCKLTQSKVRGPHTDHYRNKSLNSVLEQQCGIWLRSTLDFEVCATTISEVWGDSISCHSRNPYGVPNDRVKIIGNTFDRNGRECVLLTGASETLCQANTVHRHSSQIFHSESGQGQRDPKPQGPWLLKGNLVTEGTAGYFLHCTGGAVITEIWIQDNVRRGWPVSVYVDPAGDLPDPSVKKIGELWVLDNTWDKPQSGGYILNARDIGAVHYRRQKGPVRKVYTPEQQLVTMRVDHVDVDAAGLYHLV